MIDNYKVGAKIALLRREKGLTGEQFAELLGVSPQAVSKWENGRNLPETALLPRLAEALGASIDALLKPVSGETEQEESCVRDAYVYIPVSDIGRAAKWYSDALGFRQVRTDPLFMELRAGFGIRVFLIPTDNTSSSVPHPQMNYQGMVQASFGFTVSNYAAVQERLRRAGAELTETMDYVGLCCKFYDPDGNAIEIWSDYPLAKPKTDAQQSETDNPIVFPRIIKSGEITVVGISGDGLRTGEVWTSFGTLYARQPFTKASEFGWEIRFYGGNKPVVAGKDIHVGFESMSAVTNGYTAVTLPESEYVVFDVHVAMGYESRNAAMDLWLADNANIYRQRMFGEFYYAIERYDERYKDDDPNSIVEIWIPIARL